MFVNEKYEDLESKIRKFKTNFVQNYKVTQYFWIRIQNDFFVLIALHRECFEENIFFVIINNLLKVILS